MNFSKESRLSEIHQVFKNQSQFLYYSKFFFFLSYDSSLNSKTVPINKHENLISFGRVTWPDFLHFFPPGIEAFLSTKALEKKNKDCSPDLCEANPLLYKINLSSFFFRRDSRYKALKVQKLLSKHLNYCNLSQKNNN